MAYVYADFETYSDAASRLARLRLHIAEVSATLGPDMSSAAGSVSHSSTVEYLAHLNTRRVDLENETLAGRGATFVTGRVRR